MVAPISQIEVFSNASVLPNGKISLGVFPVNNNAQRSATLRGENSVKIVFNSGQSIPIPAFAFIEYDGQLFFTKEIYRPEPKGNNVYEYNVKFVSFDNLLSKPQAYRRVVVGSGAEQQTWNEPDIEIVGTLQTIAEVVCESIKASAVRYEGVFADLLSKVEIVSNEVSLNSESKAFSFQGQKISQVLESVANDYEIDYWFEQVGNMTNGITKMVLHFCKYERTDIDPLVLSDKTRVNRLNPYDPASPPNPRKPTVSGGLEECTFANEWSGVVQRITPFGSERNITRQQAIINEMFVSYGKRLRLEYDHSCTIDGTTYPHAYAVKDEDGNTIPLSVDENGAVYVPGVTTGEETIEKYDDIYPRGHFRVTHVTQRGVDTQIFTVYAIPTEERNGQFVDLTDAEIDAMQADPNKRLFPIDIQDGQTLSLHFESGFLNGREFEVANKSAKMVWTGDGYKVDPDNVNAHWIACFEINPEGDNNDSPQVPYGNMVPRGKLDVLGYEGDMFAIFNMDMPPYYKESAMNELAQKAYDEITAILSTRPEVKCKGNEEFFMRQNLCLGLRVKVTSDLFGEGTEFVSRVTNYSYQLSRPNKVDFRLCSSRVQGSISVLKGAIADQTQAVSGVQQTARSLSRRAFRDSQEMARMLQAVVAEMMVVGVERNQFTFTMGIECLESAASPLTRKFSGLRITAGEIQHTQEPYIKDNWEGHYTVDATTLTVDKNNHSIGTDATEEIRNTPYYLYAVIQAETGKANMELWAEKKDGENDEAYLLLGILSSEFLDGNTSLRVFNRSNGFTQIAGGTITTEQLQDPTRQLIIDMSSNPPRIIAKRGAQIIGNITFISSSGAETNLATKMNNVDEELAKEIGGENLYTGTPDISLQFDGMERKFNPYSTGVTVKTGVDYVVSAKEITVGYASTITVKIKKTGQTDKVVAHIGTGGLYTYGLYDTFKLDATNDAAYDGGEIILTSSYAGSTTASLKSFMAQVGQKPTTFQTHVKYLAEAFENAARQGSTDIDGGLLMTCLLKLRNLAGNVTAGMSGLTEDAQGNEEPILMWGGANYHQALEAALPKSGQTLPDYKYTDGAVQKLITTLLRKDGTGKIGCFRVVDEDEVAVYDESGVKRVVITSAKIADQPIPNSHVCGPWNLSRSIVSNDDDKTINDDVLGSSSFKAKKTGKIKATLSASMSAFTSVNIYSGYGSPTASAYFRNGYIKLHDDDTNEDVFVQSINNFGCSSSCNNSTQAGNVSDNDSAVNTVTAVIDLTVTKDHNYTLSISGTMYVYKNGTNQSGAYSGGGTASVSVIVNAFGVIYTDMCTYICADGISVMANSSLKFDITNDGAKLGIKAMGLQEGDSGLSSGMLYKDSSGYLKIKL